MTAKVVPGEPCPIDFPPWNTVHHYYQVWNSDGTWQKILAGLRPLARVQAGRGPTPSAAAVDSQSVKTTLGGKERGIDDGKKENPRAVDWFRTVATKRSISIPFSPPV
jgi:transposase